MSLKIHVITHFVSPYQVELFNAVSASGSVELFVTYLYDAWKDRHWDRISIEHPHCVARDSEARTQSQRHVDESDVVVFNTYRDRFVHRMIPRPARRRAAWAFWGERPAFRFKGRLGTAYRRWRLSALLHSRAPIWGIGSWAAAKYQTEFGGDRSYEVLPYYSDLGRFRRTADACNGGSTRRLLFSGALTSRKGVDLLCAAIRTLILDGHDIHATFIGTGELEKDLQEQLGRFEQQVCLAGFQDWPQLPRWYHGADALIAPSRYDGWGLIVPEGLAAGLPVLATDQMGAAVDLIQDGQNGWICKAGDAQSLLAALRRLAEMPAEQLCEHRRLAEASVAGHQLGDGADRFATLCETAFDSWESGS